MPTKGVIAAGHTETARAAAAVLEEGGNAFDAVLAAIFTACVVEPVLSSLGGGGFLTARPAVAGNGGPVVYDFFAHTPKRKIPAAELDFYPIVADFGTVTQDFHIGRGAIATPGTVKGLFDIHRDLGTMPMTRLVEPAIALARDGFQVTELQAYLYQVVGPIYMASAASREIFESRVKRGDLRQAGETMNNSAFADTLDALAREGEALFYKGDIAQRIAAECKTGGGSLSAHDLAAYRVVKRRPLDVAYGTSRIYTNPPPSTGGILIAFALEMLKDVGLGACEFGSIDHLSRLARVMDLTNKARIESRLHETLETGVAGALLDPALLAQYRARVLGRPHTGRGTTHVSIIDADGNAAALTLSNGEGCGHIVPGTGIMLNNMLGEEDIQPSGFHNWPTDTRISSMMAPSLALDEAGGLAALGSGGSNRLRTAILQVLVGMLDFGLAAKDAVEAPRLHVEGGLLSVEPGFAPAVVDLLARDFDDVSRWDRLNLFFGGVHVARFGAALGSFSGGGDPRRGGVTVIV